MRQSIKPEYLFDQHPEGIRSFSEISRLLENEGGHSKRLKSDYEKRRSLRLSGLLDKQCLDVIEMQSHS